MSGLLQWLWDGTVLAAGTAMALAVIPRLTASTRYLLWCVTLAVTMFLPVVRHLVSAIVPIAAGPSAAGTVGTALAPMPSAGLDAEAVLLMMPAAPDWLLSCLVGVWFGSLLVAAGRIVHDLRTLRRLRAGSRPLPASLARSLERTRRAGGRPVNLRASSAILGACALGLSRRPTILLSDRLLATLDRDDLELIVRHEQAHLSRYDDWAALIQSCVVAVAGLHPAVRFIGAQLDREREAACDDAVAVKTGDARRYATCLADTADAIVGAGRRVRPTLIPQVGSGSLLSRVHRLLDPRVSRSASPQRLPLTVGGLCLTIAAVTTAAMGPVIAAADKRPANRAAAVSLVATQTAQVAMPAAAGLASDDGKAAARSTAPASGASEPGPAPLRRSRRAAPSSTSAGSDTLSPAATIAAAPAPMAHAATPAAAVAAAPLAGRVAAPALLETPATKMEPLAATPLPPAIPFSGTVQSATAGWAAASDAGAAIGRRAGRIGSAAATTSREAGTAIGGYFTRAGKAVAERF